MPDNKPVSFVLLAKHVKAGVARIWCVSCKLQHASLLHLTASQSVLLAEMLGSTVWQVSAAGASSGADLRVDMTADIMQLCTADLDVCRHWQVSNCLQMRQMR